jgi:hypothetical protein
MANLRFGVITNSSCVVAKVRKDAFERTCGEFLELAMLVDGFATDDPGNEVSEGSCDQNWNGIEIAGYSWQTEALSLGRGRSAAAEWVEDDGQWAIGLQDAPGLCDRVRPRRSAVAGDESLDEL